MLKKNLICIIFLTVNAALFAQVDTGEFLQARTPPPVETLPPVPQNATDLAPIPAVSNGETEIEESGEEIKVKEGIKDLLSNREYSSRHLEPYRRFTWSSSYSFGLANDFLIGVYDILAKGDTKYKKDRLVTIDLNDIAEDRVIQSKGLNLYIGASIKPLTIAWNGKNDDETFKDWGWGFSIGAMDARSDINLSRDLLLLIAEGNKKPDSYSTFSASGAVFAETVAFNYNRRNISKRFSFSVTPAHYIPLIYLPKSDITVHVQTTEDPAKVLAEYTGTVDVWSGFDFENKRIDWRSGGFDLTLNAELAVLPGMDIGLTGTHIPIVPAHLTMVKKYALSGVFFEGEGLVDAFTGGNTISRPNFNNSQTQSGSRRVLRPMRIDSYFLIRPFKTDVLVFRPDFGMTFFNPSETEYVNYGMETDLNAGRWFTLSFFTGIYDGLFHNKLKFDFHWRIIQMFLGVELASQDFRRSWELKGAALNLGFAVGF
jgi:hypothetical protein